MLSYRVNAVSMSEPNELLRKQCRPIRTDHEYFELIVWFADDSTIWGFQLCYDRGRSERAFTWTAADGYSHNRIVGEPPALHIPERARRVTFSQHRLSLDQPNYLLSCIALPLKITNACNGLQPITRREEPANPAQCGAISKVSSSTRRFRSSSAAAPL